MQINNRRTINAWCMYDWANSVYSLVITTSIFPLYYDTFTIKDELGNVDFFGIHITDTVLYSYALSFSYLFVMIIVPVLSGLADVLGAKKSFMKVFVYLGSLACASLWFYDGSQVELAILGAVVASIGFSGSLVFYDAFLPEIASEDLHDRISARGYAFGYIGSVLLLILNLVMIQNHAFFGFESIQNAMRFSFLLVAFWWAGFSQIPFYFLKERKGEVKSISGGFLTTGYKELMKVFQKIRREREIRIFLQSYFFYNTGVQTVMLLAATFAANVIGMEGGSLILVVLIIQVVAIVGAWLFSRLSERKGNKLAIQVMLFIWIAICFAAYLTYSEIQFYGVAFVVGLVMGGIQSLSRATYAKLIPDDETDTASFFSFFELTYYFSVVIGTFGFGLIEQLTNDMRNNALLLGVFFLIGYILLLPLKYKFKTFSKEEQENITYKDTEI